MGMKGVMMEHGKILSEGYPPAEIAWTSKLLVALLCTCVWLAICPGTVHAETGMVQVPGGALYYERAGEGPVVVLLHDGVVHSACWDDVFPALAEDYDVVRHDRRGFGRSPMPDSTFSHEDDLDELLTALGIDSAHFVGVSSGGRLAVDYILAYPERVRSLTLIGAVIRGMAYTDHFLDRGGHLREEYRESLYRFCRYVVFEDPYEFGPDSEALRARVWEMLEAHFPDTSGRFDLVRLPSRPALPNLGEIQVPTLILVGEFDIPDCHANAGALEGGIAGARRVIIRNSGHLVQLEQPEAFLEQFRAFITLCEQGE